MQFSQRWHVRTYEVDENGHVNNAVYLQWAEQLTAEHAEAMGFGREWSLARGRAWLVRRSEVERVLDDREQVAAKRVARWRPMIGRASESGYGPADDEGQHP